MIFVNFKTYQKGTGSQAVKLAKICQKVSWQTRIEIRAVVQAADIFPITKTTSLPVWAQHVDSVDYGPHTGQILPEVILAAGAKGTLLNHSEKKLPPEVIKKTIRRCHDLGLKVLVCSENLEEAQETVQAGPDLIAYEPPELIGSQTTSVSASKPEVIKDFASQIRKVPVLVGAGIHTQEDVKKAVGLGAVGILVAGDIVLGEDPEKELLDLAQGFKNEKV